MKHSNGDQIFCLYIASKVLVELMKGKMYLVLVISSTPLDVEMTTILALMAKIFSQQHN